MRIRLEPSWGRAADRRRHRSVHGIVLGKTARPLIVSDPIIACPPEEQSARCRDLAWMDGSTQSPLLNHCWLLAGLLFFLSSTSVAQPPASGKSRLKPPDATLSSSATSPDPWSPDTSPERDDASLGPIAPPTSPGVSPLIYGSPAAEKLVHQARQFDPLYCPREQSDRKRAVDLYRQAMEAQPGAKLNAVLANRIAQLYATYQNREKGVRFNPVKAVFWWNRCLELTDRTQLLWAQAQMGLATVGGIRGGSESSLFHLKEILKLDPNTIQLENWKRHSTGPFRHLHQPDRLRQELRELQKKVREEEIPYFKKLMAEKERISRLTRTIPCRPKDEGLGLD